MSLPFEEEGKPPPTHPGHRNPQLGGFPPAGYLHSVTLVLSGSFFFFGGGNLFLDLAKASPAQCINGAHTARGHDRGDPGRGARSAAQSLP